MTYDEKLRYAVLNGLLIHFGVSPIDIVCMSMNYQQALMGVERVMEILTEEQKGALFLEFDGINLHQDKINDIHDKITMLKKHEFANQEAIKIEERKLHMAAADTTKAMMLLSPNLVNMITEFCLQHVHKTMNKSSSDD